MILLRLLAAVLLVLAAPAAALACPVCGLAGPGNNGWAYFAMTIVLSLTPLVFMGGVAYWVYRRSRVVGEQPVAPRSGV